MITRPVLRVYKLSSGVKCSVTIPIRRDFSTSKAQAAKNCIYAPVRRPDEFQSYLLLSTSSRIPLLTFWTASYCNTCRAVSPILNELIKSGIGEEEGGVSFCEIEYDSPDIMNDGLGMTYMITSMPTLLSFDRGEAQTGTKVTDPKQMKNKEWLKEWIRNEARRQGSGGAGLGTFGFGGLFGKSK
ncbi:uncharacterized protein LY89DRAFT_650170 [Mollisia scopiformis]|uniref:Thioredoxin domain-containing protein n=1 Tax=Mollisia scopiformis TaxID=149040 RepID=A0A194X2I5_MOLSC|nr:uncharacterized protein LY89DRAFT_650170 [Mollisia scopiformis]KUJ14388.1 hypothetical protein LY89DRAFT_650170 [Mollisia scopiformis]